MKEKLSSAIYHSTYGSKSDCTYNYSRDKLMKEMRVLFDRQLFYWSRERIGGSKKIHNIKK